MYIEGNVRFTIQNKCAEAVELVYSFQICVGGLQLVALHFITDYPKPASQLWIQTFNFLESSYVEMFGKEEG